eukprot:5797709-Amphidinium_carterae.1
MFFHDIRRCRMIGLAWAPKSSERGPHYSPPQLANKLLQWCPSEDGHVSLTKEFVCALASPCRPAHVPQLRTVLSFLALLEPGDVLHAGYAPRAWAYPGVTKRQRTRPKTCPCRSKPRR